jgi:molybdopterin-guanine dinucleotide biosynthesis protein A
MGQDKSKLLLAGERMLQRQIRLLHSVCRSVAVLGPPQNFPGLEVPVFPDERAGRGPLGGLYTGLLHTRTEFNLFLGCDLPFMEASFLRYLCRRALERQADVTVPESHGRGFEPLCAVYRRRALRAVRRRLESGENKVTRAFPRLRCEIVPWQEVSRLGFNPRIFVNMNTPEDYEEAKRLVSVRSRY